MVFRKMILKSNSIKLDYVHHLSCTIHPQITHICKTYLTTFINHQI